MPKHEIIPGIYQIINILNGKSYIGSSKNIHKRHQEHLRELRRNIHHNTHLQRSFNKNGESSFLLRILEKFEEYTPEFLFEMEQEWIDLLKPEYNIGPVGGGNNFNNNPNKEEISKNISKGIKAHYANLTQQEKIEKYNKKAVNYPTYSEGGIFFICPVCKTEQITYVVIETCLKCSRPKAGKKIKAWWDSEEGLAHKKFISENKSGENSARLGKKFSQESIDKMSESHKEKYNNLSLEDKIEEKIKSKNPYKKSIYLINGNYYLSMIQASAILNMSLYTINKYCKSKDDKFKEYEQFSIEHIIENKQAIIDNIRSQQNQSSSDSPNLIDS